MEKENQRFAPKGKVWICNLCGKISELDQYGIDGKYDFGWDESCTLNSILVTLSEAKRIKELIRESNY